MTYTDTQLLTAVMHFAPTNLTDHCYFITRAPRSPLRVWAPNKREARRLERAYRERIEGRIGAWFRGYPVTDVRRVSAQRITVTRHGYCYYMVSCECGWGWLGRGRSARSQARLKARDHRSQHIVFHTGEF